MTTESPSQSSVQNGGEQLWGRKPAQRNLLLWLVVAVIVGAFLPPLVDRVWDLLNGPIVGQENVSWLFNVAVAIVSSSGIVIAILAAVGASAFKEVIELRARMREDASLLEARMAEAARGAQQRLAEVDRLTAEMERRIHDIEAGLHAKIVRADEAVSRAEFVSKQLGPSSDLYRRLQALVDLRPGIDMYRRATAAETLRSIPESGKDWEFFAALFKAEKARENEVRTHDKRYQDSWDSLMAILEDLSQPPK